MSEVTLRERYRGEGASSYNSVRQTSPRWKLEHETVARMLQPHRGKSVLDLPVGTGRFVPLYQELECSLTGVDLSSDMLAEAVGEARRVGYPMGRFEIGDAVDIDPATIAADVGVCLRFLNWLPADKAEVAFRNIAAACREELIVSLTSIDESKFDDRRRPAIERRLANAHAKPSGEGLPPNGPHSWMSFARWIDQADFEIRESQLIVEGRDHLVNEIHRLARR